jgi:hypothetical protein
MRRRLALDEVRCDRGTGGGACPTSPQRGFDAHTTLTQRGVHVPPAKFGAARSESRFLLLAAIVGGLLWLSQGFAVAPLAT